MIDFRIRKNRDWATIEALTYVGERWLERNMSQTDGEWKVRTDCLEDWIKDVQDKQYEVEVI